MRTITCILKKLQTKMCPQTCKNGIKLCKSIHPKHPRFTSTEDILTMFTPKNS